MTLTVAISGLFDLQPIALSWLNEKLRLSPEEVQSFSPIRQIGAGVPTIVAVGEAELPELVRHTRDYCDAIAEHSQTVTALSLIGHKHFSVLDDLADPRGEIMSAVAKALALDRRP